MRRAVLVCAMLAAGFAKGSNYATTFSIVGGITPANYISLQLDITVNARFYGVNGSLISANGIGAPVTGTCQSNSAGGIFCVLQGGYLNYIVDLGSNLTGTVKVGDQNGNVVAVAPLNIASVK